MVAAVDRERARELLAAAGRVVALTGAGLSADSGVPTFRDVDGLWRRFRPEDLATPEAFARDPRLVWQWYCWRRELVSRCRPNLAHHALAHGAGPRRALTVVTQNVDGLHAQAAAAARGAEPVPVVELHGSLFGVRCLECGCRSERRASLVVGDDGPLPRCDSCSGLLRPDVVWFGESLDVELLQRAFDAARGADVCLVVGTSSLVHPAASVATATQRAGGAVIEVNAETTPLTPRAAISLRGRALDIVPELLGPLAPTPGWGEGASREASAAGGGERDERVP